MYPWKRRSPSSIRALVEIYETLEKHYHDMQDIEFTIQEGNLWMLQTRNGKRTAAAAVQIAVDMVGEGLINKREAVLRVTPEQIDQLLHPQIDPKAKKKIIGKGLPASPGAQWGAWSFPQRMRRWRRGRERRSSLSVWRPHRKTSMA
jgi:pyruvate,orthophosphate dikinase